MKADLEKVQRLVLLSRKRESRKHHQARTIHNLLTEILFRHDKALRDALKKITGCACILWSPAGDSGGALTSYRHDKLDYFRNPVSKAEIPDYYEVIKNPMCWTTIEGKLDRYEFWDVQAFKVLFGIHILYAHHLAKCLYRMMSF